VNHQLEIMKGNFAPLFKVYTLLGALGKITRHVSRKTVC